MWLKSFLPLDDEEEADDFGLSLALFASDLPALALACAALSPPLFLLRPRLDLSLLLLLRLLLSLLLLLLRLLLLLLPFSLLPP